MSMPDIREKNYGSKDDDRHPDFFRIFWCFFLLKKFSFRIDTHTQERHEKNIRKETKNNRKEMKLKNFFSAHTPQNKNI